ncbi:DLIC-domain-containing protein [Trametes coccinea BRFM310]|uniref:DLIC-domain-containing protein n=1 Tax=Trametes coccinea (strain BRFM310) TaxID=1353009 RepID=A0A1Y2IU34_TRAC3|nr:DLIC-domain-containing protein [Trametes coccinea BRFM310]
MENSRPSSPDAPPQDLWSSILDSVSSSRSIPSKQVIVLGEPSSGKSTLVSALLQKPPPEEVKEEQRTDFALGYDWADVRDDADEDTLARLSVYTVPSSAPAYTSLLPYFVPPRTSLPHTLVMVVLDWTRPWAFIQELETWLQWVEKWVKGDGSRELDIAKEENRERLQAHWQYYAEPSSEPLPATSTVSTTLLPLGPGTLTHNSAGVPIVVVCTKADLIDEGNDIIGSGPSGMGGMVKGKGGEWEERTDSIMQVLRTICLKYGAGLFYTTPQPTTLQALRQYALHMLFMPPAPSPAAAAPGEVAAPGRNPFPFQQKPNALDRDRIVIPAGWDSWGKIAVLREGFDAKLWGEAWENDLDAPEDDTSDPHAKKLYASLVPDLSRKPPPLPPLNNPTPEQIFLAKNYDENAKKPDRDPRGAFRNPNETAAAGIVGPMGSSSFNLPNVERALTEMESVAGAAAVNALNVSTARDPARGLSSRAGGRAANAGLSIPTGGAALGLGRSAAPSPAPMSATTPNSADDQSQHQALKAFFDNLINKRSTRVDDKSAAASPATAKSPEAENGADEGS